MITHRANRLAQNLSNVAVEWLVFLLRVQ